MNPNYPEDLYDDDDYIVEKRMSELRKEMYSHLIMGAGFGIMLTVALAGVIAWFIG
jgi:hypothetical protein